MLRNDNWSYIAIGRILTTPLLFGVISYSPKLYYTLFISKEGHRHLSYGEKRAPVETLL